MCNKAVKKKDLWLVKYVYGNFKKQKMKAVKKNHAGLAKNPGPKKQK